MRSSCQPEDMDALHRGTDRFIAQPENLPFCFRYGGRVVTGIPADWHPAVASRSCDNEPQETRLEGRDPSGLTISVLWRQYTTHPVVEWTVWITNAGPEPSDLIEDFQALDQVFHGTDPVIEHSTGDTGQADGYSMDLTPLGSGQTLTIAPRDGRPSDGAFPYFRVMFREMGWHMAVGWPGQWRVTFRSTEQGLCIQAGQEVTRVRLEPGETMRSPCITLLAWAGDTERGTNLWRRWYREHILPRPAERPLAPKLACACNDGGVEYTAATEENQRRFMDRFTANGIAFDVWWIDAGWYPCPDTDVYPLWIQTGNWRADPRRFPSGLGPVGRAAKAVGAELLLWFEPERVFCGTELYREHPNWLLRRAGDLSADDWESRNRLLDLGNPECRIWLTEHLSQLIQSGEVGVYRQDCNIAPLRFWRDNEGADRRGMVENLYVQGYLQLWDDLLRRNPGLWIDSCASGGGATI